ncbi:winged helix-turn-helix domain-containing protein [Paenibacillus lautus]
MNVRKRTERGMSKLLHRLGFSYTKTKQRPLYDRHSCC